MISYYIEGNRVNMQKTAAGKADVLKAVLRYLGQASVLAPRPVVHVGEQAVQLGGYTLPETMVIPRSQLLRHPSVFADPSALKALAEGKSPAPSMAKAGFGFPHAPPFGNGV